MDEKFSVTKCVCSNVTFSEMKRIIADGNLRTIDDLKTRISVAENCGLCIPYIEKIFETGKTSFDIINTN